MSNNPFPGLRAFEQNETHLFFGRDGQSNALLKRLQDSHFLALVGVSGSGKSSLVRAGLLPALYGGLMSAVDSDWRIAVFRPGNNPIGNMARALITQAGFGGQNGMQEMEIAVAETTLRRGNLGLLELIRQARNKFWDEGKPFLGKNENVLIVVDQFEELFRIIEQYDELVRVKQLSEGNTDLAPSNVADSVDAHPREEASAFVKLLLESTRKNDENIYIIVTMRSDYLGETAQFWGMPERINEGQYLIPRMTRDERRQAIVGPVAVAGGSISEALVNQLLNDAGENPGQLPILQHALMRMWELAQRPPQKNGGLNLKHYERIGKLSGALSQHANEAFDELSPPHQELAAKIFKCLTEKGLANRETRRPMTLADICSVVGAKETDVNAVVECFRKEGRWFLMPPPPKKLEPDTLIDISHESLISGWDKLNKWVNEEAESARTYKRLADTAILKELAAEDFYRGPALQVALKWRQDNAPNAAWARRYHPEFTKAIAFLDDSLEDTQKREKAEKDRTERELRRTRNYNIGLVILVIVSAGIAVYAYSTKLSAVAAETEVVNAQAKILEGQALALETEKKQVAKQTELAEFARGEQARAVKAEKIAIDAAGKLQASLDKEKKALKEANEAKALAIAKREEAERLQKENEEQGITYGYFNTAFDHVIARDYKDAISTLESALAYFDTREKDASTDAEKEKRGSLRISAVINMADVHRSDSEPGTDQLAVNRYDQAFQLIGSSNDKLLATTLMKAGSVWKDSKSVVKARQAAGYYERAASVYGSNLKRSSESARAWVEAGKIHLKFKDNPGLDRAWEDFNRGTSLLARSQLALTNKEIAEYYAKLVETSESTDEDDDSAPKDDGEKKDAGIQERLQEEGAKFFDKAAGAFESFKDSKNAAAMQVRRGEILGTSISDKLLKPAAEAFISASMLHQRMGNPTKQASVLVEAAELFLENSSSTAKALANDLLDQAARIDQKNSSKQAATLSKIGSIYAGVDPLLYKETALNYYQQAIVFAQQQNDKASQVTAILAKARAVEQLGDQAQVDQLYADATAVYHDDPAKRVDTLLTIGRSILGLAKEKERVTKAEEFFNEALSVAGQNKSIAAKAHLSIGSAYQPSVTQRAKAIRHFEDALALFEAERDQYGQAMTLYRLIAVKPREASELANRALPLFANALASLQTSGNEEQLAEAYYGIASMLHRQKKEYKEALENYTKALLIFVTLPDKAGRASSTRNQIRTVERLIEPAR
jgi:hypothetical protein